jgi:hypothetical protein
VARHTARLNDQGQEIRRGCWLRECGHDPESALAQVQHLYASHMPKIRIHPESPQTPAQKDYIRKWTTTG